MITSGLLWYDDDTRRPVAQKIAEAAERYRERLGYEPTACELNPAQAPAPASAPAGQPTRRRKSTPVVPDIQLRLVPNERLRKNYFLIGIAEGDRVKRVPGWHDLTDEVAGVRPFRRAKTVTPAKTTKPAAAAVAKAIRPVKPVKPAQPTASAADAKLVKSVTARETVKRAKIAPKSAAVAKTAKPTTLVKKVTESTPVAKTAKPTTLVKKAKTTESAEVTKAAKPKSAVKAPSVAPQLVAAPAIVPEPRKPRARREAPSALVPAPGRIPAASVRSSRRATSAAQATPATPAVPDGKPAAAAQRPKRVAAVTPTAKKPGTGQAPKGAVTPTAKKPAAAAQRSKRPAQADLWNPQPVAPTPATRRTRSARSAKSA